MNKLNRLYIEDFIFVTYFVVITLNLISNYLEEYDIKNNTNKFDKLYKNIDKIVFIIIIVIYIYFLYISIKDLKENKKNTKLELVFLANFFIFIAGLIGLYLVFKNDDNPDLNPL